MAQAMSYLALAPMSKAVCGAYSGSYNFAQTSSQALPPKQLTKQHADKEPTEEKNILVLKIPVTNSLKNFFPKRTSSSKFLRTS